jgi:hypothetical protein
MADKKISQLTDATTPLAGTEELPLVQGGVTKKVAASNFLLPSNIGSTVQGYDADTAKLDVAQTWSAAQSFNNTIGVGGATPAASGAGVTFPATQSASSDANTLDDYEEGTWTPSVGRTTTFGTYTAGPSDGGKYTKIGNVVYFSCRVGGTNTTASGGSWVIRGLPFTTANDVTWGRTTYSIIGPDGTPGGANSDRISIYASSNTNDLQVGVLVSGSNYQASGFYYVS